jgi:hypothetical protein
MQYSIIKIIEILLLIVYKFKKSYYKISMCYLLQIALTYYHLIIKQSLSGIKS